MREIDGWPPLKNLVVDRKCKVCQEMRSPQLFVTPIDSDEEVCWICDMAKVHNIKELMASEVYDGE